MVTQKRVFLIFGIGFLLMLYAHDMAALDQMPCLCKPIDQQQINNYKEKIIQEFKHTTRLKIALAAVGLLSVSLGAYKLLFPAVPKPLELLASSIHEQSKEEFSQKKSSIVDKDIKETVSKIRDAHEQSKEGHDVGQTVREPLGPSVSSMIYGHSNIDNELKETVFKIRDALAKEGYDVGQSIPLKTRLKLWIRFWGTQSFSIVLGSFIANVLNPLNKYFKKFDERVDKTIDYIFYEQNLAWFLATHTQFQSLIDQIKLHAQAVSVSTHKEKEYHHAMIITTWNLYIQQLCSVLGFMHYKASIIEKQSIENGKRAQLIINKILERAHESINAMQTAIHEASACIELVTLLHASVEQDFNDFVFTEQLIFID